MIVSPEGSPYPSDGATGASNNATNGNTGKASGSEDASGSDKSSDSDKSSGGDKASGGENMIDRVVHGVHQAVDRMAEKAVPTAERVKSGVSGAAEAVQSKADHLGEMQEEWLTACRDSVRDHPLKSVGLAVVAGVVLSRILR